MKRALAGGCACGATRYRLASAPLFVHACHCRDCQRLAGAPFVVNAMIETDRVSVTTGAPVTTDAPSSSKSPHHVFRCAGCGAPLWSRYGVRAAMVYVRAATLDDPPPPRAHIFTRSKAPWLILDDAPAFAGWYDRRKVWPADSLARLAAARER